jgi:hypothetical protein
LDLSAAKHLASSSPMPDDAPVIKTVSAFINLLFSGHFKAWSSAFRRFRSRVNAEL